MGAGFASIRTAQIPVKGRKTDQFRRSYQPVCSIQLAHMEPPTLRSTTYVLLLQSDNESIISWAMRSTLLYDSMMTFQYLFCVSKDRTCRYQRDSRCFLRTKIQNTYG